MRKVSVNASGDMGDSAGATASSIALIVSCPRCEYQGSCAAPVDAGLSIFSCITSNSLAIVTTV